jgi:hypothetical protein
MPHLWETNGIITNPSTGQVLADTGPLLQQDHDITVVISSSLTIGVDVELRNAANDATLASQHIRVLANDSRSVSFTYSTLEGDQRLRVVAHAAIIGIVQASIMTLD